MLLILVDRNLDTLPKNKKTLEQLSRRLSDFSLDHEIKTFLNLEIFIESGKSRIYIDGRRFEDFSHVFFRRVGKYKHVANIIASYAKARSIQTIDSYYNSVRGSSKLNQMFHLATTSLSVPRTYFSPQYGDKKLDAAIDFLHLPIVAKMSSGRMGTGVFLAHSKSMLGALLEEHMDKEFILQEFIPNSFDYRLLVLGDTVAIAEKRTRQQEESFRNNVGLGAKEEFLPVSDVPNDIQSLAVQAAQTMSIEIAGVDIVTDSLGKSYVLETNMCPAFTHDEKLSQEIQALSNYFRIWLQKKS